MNYEQIVGQIVQASRDYRLHDRRRVECALHAGRFLIQAKASVGHGDFSALLARAELKPRTAQRWMALARAGWTIAEIQKAGGLTAAASRTTARQLEQDLENQVSACKSHIDDLELTRDMLIGKLINRDGKEVTMAKVNAFREGQAERRRLATEHDRIAGEHSAELRKRRRFERWAKAHGWTPDMVKTG